MTEAGGREPASGQIEVISGGMFSGKSEELLRRLRRAVIARQKVQAFKPAADTRHAPQRLITRDNREVSAISVRDSTELARVLEPDVQVIGIDEAQFFDEGLITLSSTLADQGVRVIIAGLDQDFLRRPFGPMPGLLALAEFVDKMHAICVVCGSRAHFTQRIAGGAELVQVGDDDYYEARCRTCYELGPRPKAASLPR